VSLEDGAGRERLIRKYELDKEILAEQEADEAAANRGGLLFNSFLALWPM
jgi:hypothetical protein